ncbi:hypothetical protein P8452_73828 [Trifolium repens]|nr:hypothetical protein P8452_73828 [Trifolium repens]
MLHTTILHLIPSTPGSGHHHLQKIYAHGDDTTQCGIYARSSVFYILSHIKRFIQEYHDFLLRNIVWKLLEHMNFKGCAKEKRHTLFVKLLL